MTNKLPCKIGDTVWCIRNYNGKPRPKEGKVSEMYYIEDMSLTIVVKNIGRGKWGKDIFATKEDAMKKIKGDIEK